MRLDNRQAAERLGVHLSGVARACERRGIPRDPHGFYLFPDGGNPEQTGATSAEQPVKPYKPTFVSGPPATGATRDNPGQGFLTACFVSDVHVPEHDAFAVRAWLTWAKARQPDIIILGGDILELESCSGHGGNIASAPMFLAEVEAGNAFLDDVQAACPDAEIAYLEGNHETRLQRKVDVAAPNLAGALCIPDLLRLKDRGIAWRPYGSVFFPSASKLGFTHGTRANDHHAKTHLNSYGTSIVYGHTHRAQFYTQGFANNRLRGAFGAPCLRSLSVDWLKGPTGWSQGFVLAHLFPDGHFTAYTIMMDQQRFVEGGVLYDGRA